LTFTKKYGHYNGNEPVYEPDTIGKILFREI